jgi:5'-3' exonuclease
MIVAPTSLARCPPHRIVADRISDHRPSSRRSTVDHHPAWEGLAVVVSDASVPGEGEYKIVDYVRRWRGSAAYAPEAAHAICGQDADLVMLGLALHEPNVLILRESVPAGRQRKDKGAGARQGAADDKGYDLLRIDRLRQYLRHEFSPLDRPNILPFPFDLEALINDFVFLCFFVGNDFLPRTPALDIREGGLDMLLLLYARLLPSLGGYLLRDGEVELRRVERLVQRVALVEPDILARRTRRDACPHEGRAPPPRAGAPGAVDLAAALETLCLVNIAALAAAAGRAPLRLGEKGWRERYYKDKLGGDDSPAARRDMAAEYVRGLRWVAQYYFQGVPSWHWYYPYHYAPFA